MTKVITLVLLWVIPLWGIAQEHLPTIAPAIWVQGNQVEYTAPTQPTYLLRATENIAERHFMNYHEVLAIDSAHSQIEIPYNIDAMPSFTFFTVYQTLDATKEQCIWGANNSQKDILLTTHRISGQERAMEYPKGNVIIPVLNTMVQSWGTKNDTPIAQKITFGQLQQPIEGIETMNGYLAEYILFNRRLSLEERVQVESALAMKYGITLKSDYVSSFNQIIWNQEENEGFNTRITAIGRDDQWKLNQKQSMSTAEPDFLSIGFTTIASSNAANATDIPNDYFILWGDNGASFVQENASIGAGRSSLLKRKWLLEVAGTIIDNLPTLVQVDFSRIVIPQGYEPALFIDRQARGNFFVEDMEVVRMSNMDNGKVTFSNVEWDTDGSGDDQFAFGFVEKETIPYFVVTPNPSEGRFTIEALLKKPVAITIRIYDMSAKLVKELRAQQNTHYRFEEQLQEAGEYFIELSTPTTTETHKIVITH